MLDTMIANMPEKTGKSLEEWFELLQKKNFAKHGEGMKFLKEEHGVSHGFANTILQLYKKSESQEDDDDLVTAQFKGKEHLKDIYDLLEKNIKTFGNDLEWAPKKTYVSVRRKKQFAILQPSTKTRFDIGLNLKGVESQGVLEPSGSFNSMCSHRIKVASKDDLTESVYHWIREAYEKAS